MRGLPRSAAPLAGLAAAAALYAHSRGLDEIARAGQLGPGFWPRLVLIGFALACAARLIGLWRHPAYPVGPADEAGGARDIVGGKLALAVLLIVLYVLGTPAVGFPLATAAFIALFMVLAGARSPFTVAASAGLGTVALLYVFIKLVYLPFPKGAGPFETVTLALYRTLGLF